MNGNGNIVFSVYGSEKSKQKIITREKVIWEISRSFMSETFEKITDNFSKVKSKNIFFNTFLHYRNYFSVFLAMRKDIDNTETVVNTVLCMLYIDLINDPALLGGDNDK